MQKKFQVDISILVHVRADTSSRNSISRKTRPRGGGSGHNLAKRSLFSSCLRDAAMRCCQCTRGSDRRGVGEATATTATAARPPRGGREQWWGNPRKGREAQTALPRRTAPRPLGVSQPGLWRSTQKRTQNFLR